MFIFLFFLIVSQKKKNYHFIVICIHADVKVISRILMWFLSQMSGLLSVFEDQDAG